MVVIGIDLGTTVSVCGTYKDGTVEIIPDNMGNRLIPSYVAFTENERFIGTAAKNQAAKNAANTIYDAKRFIGHTTIPVDLKDVKYPFSLESSDTLKIYVPVLDKWFLPEEISAMVLSYIKLSAEQYTGEEVTGAVITVPAYFDNAQKKCTKNAAKIAGLEVIRIINEPTSAALAYGYGFDSESEEKSVLIMDIGGGTTDITVLDIGGDIIEVKATRGDMHFGGEDFDEQLMEYCINEFNKQLAKKGLGKAELNSKMLRRLKMQCEKAKIVLSSATSTEIEIDSLWNGEDLAVGVTRAKFENINNKYFKKVRTLLKMVLQDAKRTTKQIDEIILVGGSTRIPKIRTIIRDYFGGKKLNHTLHPDEAIAWGAALQAHYLTDEEENTDKKLLVDVIPLSLGIETKGGIMDIILKKNSTIPAKCSNVYSTSKDGQSSVTVKIYEGERALCSDNKFLGKFNLRGIAPASRGVAQVEVIFEVDENGLLQVSAFDQATPNKIEKISVESGSNLSSDEIYKLVNEAQEMNDRDKVIRNKVDWWNQIELLVYHIEEFLEEQSHGESTILKEDQFTLREIVDDIMKWMDENSGFKDPEYDQQRLSDKHFEIQSKVNIIMSRVYSPDVADDAEDSEDAT